MRHRSLNFAFWFAAVHDQGPECQRLPHLPEFNPEWYEALRVAKKEWLFDQVREIELLPGNERQAALMKLSGLDLEMLGMKRTKLEVRA